MNTIKDGDSAFPRPVSWSEKGGTHRGTLGMTLRDYFAGQALTGMMARKDSDGWTKREVADDCYLYAESMLATRNRI